jgi:hypothetical protein
MVDEAEGKIQASSQGAWQLSGQTFLDSITANLTGGSLVVVSMLNESALPVTGFAARMPLRTQRRRASRVT